MSVLLIQASSSAQSRSAALLNAVRQPLEQVGIGRVQESLSARQILPGVYGVEGQIAPQVRCSV